MNRFKNILCVVETAKACKHALERAVTLAENNQASLTVVDVVEAVTAGIGMPEGGPITADLQAAMASAHTQELEVLIEPYRKRIEADLVVMGTVARTGIPGFIMGNTAETVLNPIDCSVLAIKPPGFVTPVTLED